MRINSRFKQIKVKGIAPLRTKSDRKTHCCAFRCSLNNGGQRQHTNRALVCECHRRLCVSVTPAGSHHHRAVYIRAKPALPEMRHDASGAGLWDTYTLHIPDCTCICLALTHTHTAIQQEPPRRGGWGAFLSFVLRRKRKPVRKR